MADSIDASDFCAILDPLPDSIRDVSLALREIILRTLPDAEEAIGGGAKIRMSLYSIGGPNRVVCGLQPTADACKLFLHGWERLLAEGFRLEGSGKHARHVKLRDVAELERVDVPRMLRIARAAVGL